MIDSIGNPGYTVEARNWVIPAEGVCIIDNVCEEAGTSH